MFLESNSIFSKVIQTFKDAVYRNSLIIKVISLTFFVVLTIAIVFTVILFYFSPELVDDLGSLSQSIFDYEDIPSPFTADMLSFIFLNNSGHFWNPIRMLVWIPVLGPLLVAFEIMLNSGMIGVISVIAANDKGIMYPLVGLVPHGLVEIPAFLLQLSSIVLWQVTITEAIFSRSKGRIIAKEKIKQGIWDALILALTSVILLFIAAVIETYVTPFFLGVK